MLTDIEVASRREDIQMLEDQIKVLEDKKNEIRQELIRDNMDKAKARFPQLTPGDKVKVVCKTWDDTLEEFTGFFKGFNIPQYCGDETDFRYVRMVFGNPKKDGTMSLKGETYQYVFRIVSLEKVTE